MKRILFGILAIAMAFASHDAKAQRYARGTVRINEGGIRADLHVFGRIPSPYSCGGYYGGYGYYGNTLSGRIGIPSYGYVQTAYYAPAPVMVVQQQGHYQANYHYINGVLQTDAYGNPLIFNDWVP